MINEKIDHFPFWTPVVFKETPAADNFFTNLAWRVGSLADQYMSFSQQRLEVTAERLDAHSIYFETKHLQNVPMWQTALKASSYILPFLTSFALLTLPAIALTIKIIFKNYLNTHIAKQAFKAKAVPEKNPVELRDDEKQVDETKNQWHAKKHLEQTKVVLVSGSLIDETTDAIVNAANAQLFAGAGVCGAIHSHAGQEVFDECQEILEKQNRSSLNCSEAVLTSSGRLAPRVKVIIHAVGPNYRIETQKKEAKNLIYQTYYHSLELLTAPQDHATHISSKVQPQPLRSIAFPSISTGIYGCPLEMAAPQALKAVKDFIQTHPNALDEVRFVFLPTINDAKTMEAYQQALDQLNEENQTENKG